MASTAPSPGFYGLFSGARAIPRPRARFIFAEAGVRLVFVAPGKSADGATGGLDRITLVVMDNPRADRLIANDPRTLGFAIPAASRVYVHYDRVHALARSHDVQPGWFLGVVIAHELAHVLLPAGHADDGVMVRTFSPDSRPPAFTRDEAQKLRDRIGGQATLAQR